MLLGVDDTDSLKGGCTTHVAVQLVLRMREELGLVPLDHPRLVRLNPVNPWKTRGNAALAIRMGAPGGDPVEVGSWSGEPLEAFPGGTDVPPTEDVTETAWRVVKDLTWHEDGRTNPGLVLAPSEGPGEWYSDALHRLLEVGPIRERLVQGRIEHREEGSGRGLIGASAAIAWPGDPHTWELLAYRPKDRWGAERQIDAASPGSLESPLPSTFDSIDPGTGALTMVPNSPCPVLYGIRGTDPSDLPKANDLVRGEPAEGWMVFRTNQATDDHLVPRRIPQVLPHESVVVSGTVADGPRTIPGGHVILTMEEGGTRLDLAAYEPTKGFREMIRRLLPGDKLVACGSVRDEPRTVNLEKVMVLKLGSQTDVMKTANPKCPTCGKGMKSIGADAGYRCLACGTKAPEKAAVVEERPRELVPGWYEVPPVARRHLARPLSLGLPPCLEAYEPLDG
jgi:tRNA(Ile2)-agmatinylcytidine synthase